MNTMKPRRLRNDLLARVHGTPDGVQANLISVAVSLAERIGAIEDRRKFATPGTDPEMPALLKLSAELRAVLAAFGAIKHDYLSEPPGPTNRPRRIAA